MTTQGIPAAPVEAPHHPAFVGWLEEHVFPGIKTIAADAQKANKLIPLAQEFLPKVVALAKKDEAVAPEIVALATEAEQILSVIAAL